MTDIDDIKDKAFEAGRLSAIRSIFGFLASELVGDERQIAGAIAQLADARQALNELGDDLGCKPWVENLHLRDESEDSEHCESCFGTPSHNNFVSRIVR